MSDFEMGFEEEPETTIGYDKDWQPEEISTHVWNGLHGVWLGVFFGFGYKGYDWYEGWAKENLPERNAADSVYYYRDQTFAMDTMEFRAWN